MVVWNKVLDPLFTMPMPKNAIQDYLLIYEKELSLYGHKSLSLFLPKNIDNVFRCLCVSVNKLKIGVNSRLRAVWILFQIRSSAVFRNGCVWGCVCVCVWPKHLWGNFKQILFMNSGITLLFLYVFLWKGVNSSNDFFSENLVLNFTFL